MLYRYADDPEAGGTLDAFADAEFGSAPTRSMLAMGGSERNRQRLARQAESTEEPPPRTGRGNADAVL